MATKRVALALIVGGCLWALIMVAYIKTHGPGSYDYMRLLFGFSRDNYMLLLSPEALLLGYGLTLLRRSFLPFTGRLFSGASLGAIVLLGVFAAGNLVWAARTDLGGHAPWPDHSSVGLIGGVLQFLSLPPLGLSLALMGGALLRSRRFRPGAFVLLVPLSIIALAPWQPIHGYPGVTFGMAWGALGLLYAALEVRASAAP
jgi:hypothetical protein